MPALSQRILLPTAPSPPLYQHQHAPQKVPPPVEDERGLTLQIYHCLRHIEQSSVSYFEFARSHSAGRCMLLMGFESTPSGQPKVVEVTVISLEEALREVSTPHFISTMQNYDIETSFVTWVVLEQKNGPALWSTIVVVTSEGGAVEALPQRGTRGSVPRMVEPADESSSASDNGAGVPNRVWDQHRRHYTGKRGHRNLKERGSPVQIERRPPQSPTVDQLQELQAALRKQGEEQAEALKKAGEEMEERLTQKLHAKLQVQELANIEAKEICAKFEDSLRECDQRIGACEKHVTSEVQKVQDHLGGKISELQRSLDWALEQAEGATRVAESSRDLAEGAREVAEERCSRCEERMDGGLKELEVKIEDTEGHIIAKQERAAVGAVAVLEERIKEAEMGLVHLTDATEQQATEFGQFYSSNKESLQQIGIRCGAIEKATQDAISHLAGSLQKKLQDVEGKVDQGISQLSETVRQNEEATHSRFQSQSARIEGVAMSPMGGPRVDETTVARVDGLTGSVRRCEEQLALGLQQAGLLDRRLTEQQKSCERIADRLEMVGSTAKTAKELANQTTQKSESLEAKQRDCECRLEAVEGTTLRAQEQAGQLSPQKEALCERDHALLSDIRSTLTSITARVSEVEEDFGKMQAGLDERIRNQGREMKAQFESLRLAAEEDRREVEEYLKGNLKQFHQDLVSVRASLDQGSPGEDAGARNGLKDLQELVEALRSRLDLLQWQLNNLPAASDCSPTAVAHLTTPDPDGWEPVQPEPPLPLNPHAYQANEDPQAQPNEEHKSWWPASYPAENEPPRQSLAAPTSSPVIPTPSYAEALTYPASPQAVTLDSHARSPLPAALSPHPGLSPKQELQPSPRRPIGTSSEERSPSPAPVFRRRSLEPSPSASTHSLPHRRPSLSPTSPVGASPPVPEEDGTAAAPSHHCRSPQPRPSTSPMAGHAGSQGGSPGKEMTGDGGSPVWVANFLTQTAQLQAGHDNFMKQHSEAHSPIDPQARSDEARDDVNNFKNYPN